MLHDGSRNRVLTKKIEKECRSDSSVVFISRQYFDQDRGADYLKTTLQGEVDSDLVAKYIVLSGSYCLLRYIENCSGCAFAQHSLRVEYGTSCSSRMNLDRRTAVNLELICNAKTGKQKESLFGVINYTKTVIGARLLRSNILRPTTDIETISMRLDLVEDLLTNNRVFVEIVALLSAFPDLDKMLNGLTAVPRNITQKTARIGIDTLIYLKQSLKLAPMLANVIENTSQKSKIVQQKSTTDVLQSPTKLHNPILLAIIRNLRDPVLKSVENEILGMLTESTQYHKSSHAMRHQECFAIRNGINGLLDVARKTFLQTVEDLYAVQYHLLYSIEIRLIWKQF